MRHTVLTVILIGILVVSAGCSGVFGSNIGGATEASGNGTPSTSPSSERTATPARGGLTLDGVGSLSEYPSTRDYLQAIKTHHDQTLRASEGFTSTIFRKNIRALNGSLAGARLSNESIQGMLSHESYVSDPSKDRYVAEINRTLSAPSLGRPDRYTISIGKYTNGSMGYIRSPKQGNIGAYVYHSGPLGQLLRRAAKEHFPRPVMFSVTAGQFPIDLNYTNVTYLGETTRDGQLLHVFKATATNVTAKETQGGISFESAIIRVYVSEDPVLIQHINSTVYTTFRGDPAKEHMVFELGQVSDVSVEEPGWVVTARNRSD